MITCDFCHKRKECYIKLDGKPACQSCYDIRQEEEMERTGIAYMYMAYKDGSPYELEMGGNTFRLMSWTDHGKKNVHHPSWRATGGHNWYMTKRIDCWFHDRHGFEWHGVLITGGMNDRARCTLNKDATRYRLDSIGNYYQAGGVLLPLTPNLNRPFLQWRDMDGFRPPLDDVRRYHINNISRTGATIGEFSAEKLKPEPFHTLLYIKDDLHGGQDMPLNKPIVQSNAFQIADNLFAIRTRWFDKTGSSRVWFFKKTKNSWREVPYNERVKRILEMKLFAQYMMGNGDPN